mmetsp:Transcript_33737/g.54035  ORF Transcript_33737/g.54035 Transcript_33737/m.54035 type:complete len:102 (-) Transcript_33737:71-376(-)
MIQASQAANFLKEESTCLVVGLLFLHQGSADFSGTSLVSEPSGALEAPAVFSLPQLSRILVKRWKYKGLEVLAKQELNRRIWLLTEKIQGMNPEQERVVHN